MPIADQSLSILEKIAILEKKAQDIASRASDSSLDEKILQNLADKLSLLGTTEDMLLSQFQDNMSAFKEFDYNIYQFFATYQPTRYFTDIVDGFANIFDKESSEHLYAYPGYLMANVQLDEYQRYPQSSSAIFDLNEKNEGNFIHSKHLNGILDILLARTENNGDKVRPLPGHLGSMMVFGVGLGYHLELLLGQHSVDNLYVFEPELDIFYSSLFTTNWKLLLETIDRRNGNIHISLGEQEEEFFDDILNQSYYYGRYDLVKAFGLIHYNTPKINNLIREYKKRFFEIVQGWGFFDDSVMSVSHMLTSLSQGVPLLKKRVLQNNNLSNYPVFIIGNGPSLDELVDTIKLYKDKAILISCGSALSALYKYGVIPDIHCEQERTFPVVEKLSYYCPKHVYEDMFFIGPTTLHPEVFKCFNNSLMAAKGQEPSASLLMDNNSIREQIDIHNYINPTVANTALSMAVGLGFENIYFLGVDLGHKKDGKHHSSKSLYYAQNGEDLDLYGYKKLSDIEVEPNFTGVFHTEPFFSASRKALERLIRENNTLNYYNMSDGAKIKGCEPLKAEEFSTVLDNVGNKKTLLAELFSQAGYQDNGSLLNELVDSLDFDGYASFCKKLIHTMDKPVSSIVEASRLIKSHTNMLRDVEVCEHDHFYQLLKGSIMHIQAMLTRVIYEAYLEQDAIDDFNSSLHIYQEFLRDSVKYYRDNALKPHYCDTDWFKPLTKFID